MTLIEIFDKIKMMPTIMSASEELSIIDELERIPLDELYENKDSLMEIIHDLMHSHMYTIYEVDKSNYQEFYLFSVWIEKLLYYFSDNDRRITLLKAASDIMKDKCW
jgi:hypothetical protein